MDHHELVVWTQPNDKLAVVNTSYVANNKHR